MLIGKGILRLTLISVISVSLVLSLLVGCAKKEPEVIKIGAILPLTGSGSVWGQNAQKGINLALEQVNAKEGIDGKKIRVILEDSQSVPKQAVNAFRKLIDVEKIQCSIVDMISSNVLAIAPIANEKKVVIISPGASSPDITYAGEYVFRNWPSDALQGEKLARFVWEKGYKKVAILFIQNEFGEGLKKAFSSTFTDLEGEITAAEPFPQGGTDFRAQVVKVKASDPEAVVLFIYPPEGVKLIRQLREGRVNVQLFATAEIENPLMLKEKSTEGVIYSFPKPPEETAKEVREFREAYRKKYGENPGIVSDIAYDAFNLLVKAVKEGGYNGPAIKDALLKIKDYHGASGIITFDENGDVIKPFIFKIIKDGKFQIYESE
jgi:branched-chain amino acid transport system substrate-binding protein